MSHTVPPKHVRMADSRVAFTFKKKSTKPSVPFDVSEAEPSRGEPIVSVGDQGIITEKPHVEEGPLVIAPMADKWKPGAPEEILEREAARALMEAATKKDEDGDENMNSIAPITSADDDSERLKRDLATLPDTADDEAYEKTPVDQFGQALLRGMGWAPGAPVGRNAKVAVQPVEYVPRHHRLGLGAVPRASTDDKPKKYVKPGEKRGPKPDLVLPPDADGRQRNYRTLDEKLVPRAHILGGPRAGANVEIVNGKHEGLRGLVVSIEEDMAKVRLIPSESEVLVPRASLSQIALYDKKEKPRRSSKPKQHREKERERLWVRTQIRVRIISKRLAGGKYYEKKGVVLDTSHDGYCSVKVGDSVVSDVKQSMLETALPKVDGRVIIVGRKNNGVTGTLIERRGRDGVASVRMDDDDSVVHVGFDDLAEMCEL